METVATEQLLALLEEESGVEKKAIKSDTVIASLVTDSLEVANIVTEIEFQFNVKLEEFTQATTFAQALRMIENG